MIPLLALLGGGLLLAILAQRNEGVVKDRWDGGLDGTGSAYRETCERVRDEQGMAEHSFGQAEKAREAFDWSQATEFLRIGAAAVEAHADTLPCLLRNLALLSRQADAIAPVQRLDFRAMNLHSLRTLGAIQGIVHSLLATSRGRLLLRIRVLRYSVPAVTRWLMLAASGAALEPAQSERWKELGHARSDIGTLTDESLESLRIVLQSLACTVRSVKT